MLGSLLATVVVTDELAVDVSSVTARLLRLDPKFGVAEAGLEATGVGY